MQFSTNQYNNSFNFHNLIGGEHQYSAHSACPQFGMNRPNEGMEEAYPNNHRVKVERKEPKALHIVQKDKRLKPDVTRVYEH